MYSFCEAGISCLVLAVTITTPDIKQILCQDKTKNFIKLIPVSLLTTS